MKPSIKKNFFKEFFVIFNSGNCSYGLDSFVLHNSFTKNNISKGTITQEQIYQAFHVNLNSKPSYCDMGIQKIDRFTKLYMKLYCFYMCFRVKLLLGNRFTNPILPMFDRFFLFNIPNNIFLAKIL